MSLKVIVQPVLILWGQSSTFLKNSWNELSIKYFFAGIWKCERIVWGFIIIFCIIPLISFYRLLWSFCFHMIISLSHFSSYSESLLYNPIFTFTYFPFSHWSMTLQASRLSTLSLQHDKRLDDESRGGKRKIKVVQERVRNAFLCILIGFVPAVCLCPLVYVLFVCFLDNSGSQFC